VRHLADPDHPSPDPSTARLLPLSPACPARCPASRAGRDAVLRRANPPARMVAPALWACPTPAAPPGSPAGRRRASPRGTPHAAALADLLDPHGRRVAAPALQWGPGTAVPHLPDQERTAPRLRYYAPLRLPRAHLGGVRGSLSCPDALGHASGCVALAGARLVGEADASAPRRESAPRRSALLRLI
jgi:hypothetical protein